MSEASDEPLFVPTITLFAYPIPNFSSVILVGADVGIFWVYFTIFYVMDVEVTPIRYIIDSSYWWRFHGYFRFVLIFQRLIGLCRYKRNKPT